MNNKEILEYIKSKNKRLISPIWAGDREFHFLCLHHIDFSDALGFEVYQATPTLKLVRENSIPDESTLDNIIARHEFKYSYFDKELESLEEWLKTSSTLVGGGCFGPLTVASGILGAAQLLRDIRKRPGLVKKFVEYITEFMMELAQKETQAGAQFFWIAEPLASLLSPDNFWEFSGRYLKQIFDAAEVPGFLHVCGQTLPHTEYMVKTGAQVLSIDYVTNIYECIKRVPDNVVILGNVNPSTLRFGTKEEVREECNKILDACRGFDNFVMSTGCSIMEDTPDENMEEMFRAVEEYP